MSYEFDDDFEPAPTAASVWRDARTVLARPVARRVERARRWWQTVRRFDINWTGFAVTRGGFFDGWLGGVAVYRPWPQGRPPEDDVSIVAAGGLCTWTPGEWEASGWQPWAPWWCAHASTLLDDLPMFSVPRGGIRMMGRS